ncbi:RNA-binding S4 domain-containing protein [Hydrotalea sp.]|uniref:RNA-binding S4 domain-containing protein n=1 Tax=Hydrotalea sp. TaxID=2881279 RepID=UPI00262D210F|nr:RNA-binding S4 domain-containing protein [Hydrotalea sp.]
MLAILTLFLQKILPSTLLTVNECCMDAVKEKIRIDKYLSCIRIFKTRSLAGEACDKGKVKYLGNNVKAAKAVAIGDEYEIKTEARKWLIKITALLDHRVAYSEAIQHYIDLTPVEDLEKPAFLPPSFHTGKRLSKIGRPTKRERRDLDNFMESE